MPTNQSSTPTAARPRALHMVAAVGLALGFTASGLFAFQTTAPQPKPGRPPATVPNARPGEAPKAVNPDGTPAAPGTANPATNNPNAKPGAIDAPREEPTVGPYVTRADMKAWRLMVHIRLNSDRPDEIEPSPGQSVTGKPAYRPKITPFEFTRIAVVFPGVESTSNSDTRMKQVKGTLRLDDQIVDQKPEVMDAALYHSGVRLLRLETDEGAAASERKERSVRDVSIEYEIPVTCYSTVYDAAAAEQIPWPKGAWPVAAASTLTPQLFVDIGFGDETQQAAYISEEAKKTVQTMFDAALKFGKVSDVKAVPPARLAKILTRQVWQDIQISGTGKVSRSRTGEFTGLDMQAPAETIRLKRGDEHDVTALTAALFRKAGIPTRTVIGMDMYAKDNAAFLKKDKASRDIRSWVEFAVYDEAKNTINWVPVDVARLRKSTSRPKDLNKVWEFFGTHEEMNSMLPFALQFHPPTDVVAYTAPGFWGWYVEPVAPHHALQAIRFDATSASKRGGEDKDDDDDKDQKDDKAKKPAPRRGY